jgi:DNA (cytosine-5)-methyltransferase 1
LGQTVIPVVDLFAGPGGLGEGFAALRNQEGHFRFDVRLSIEKDPVAHKTLELRSFFRSFAGRAPDAYYDYLIGSIDRTTLFSDKRFEQEANRAKGEAWLCELAEDTHSIVSKRVKEVVRQSDRWVLIGGPPCQAYSLVGRSRMRSTNPDKFERDKRHFLYREYLRLLVDHAPPIFVMENVKGLLSSKINGRSIFNQIISDLSRPNGDSLRYRILSLSDTGVFGPNPDDYVIKCERHGIPQARHRVILCGVREDIPTDPAYLSVESEPIGVEEALVGLPPVRSQLSDEPDNHAQWLSVLNEACSLMKTRAGDSYADVTKQMRKAVALARSVCSPGKPFTSYATVGECSKSARELQRWYRDARLSGVTGHQSRGHMRSDLHRYLFASSYAVARGNASPRLQEFPRFLLPKHKNARRVHMPFDDRFWVQVSGRPSTTIVSHIAKDGHYYIHPDPGQCRSFTVREAARIQTFPDNYHFEGNRTEQYHQVGNAVPPLLAIQIASLLAAALSQEVSPRGKVAIAAHG